MAEDSSSSHPISKEQLFKRSVKHTNHPFLYWLGHFRPVPNTGGVLGDVYSPAQGAAASAGYVHDMQHMRWRLPEDRF